MTDRNRVQLVTENASVAQKIWAIITGHPLFPLLGGFAGAALYGATIVLTGYPFGVIGFLAGIGIGAVVATAGKLVVDTIQKSEQPEQVSLVQEDQVIALDMCALDIQQYGLDIIKALALVRLSQFYWVGTAAEWRNIKEKLNFSAPLNTCPEKDMTRVMVVYTVKGPNEPIRFSKGGIMGFLRGYAPRAQGESGLLYLHPDMEGDIMRYGFKAE